VDDVEFSPEDATRSDRDFLVEMVRVAVEAGATTYQYAEHRGLLDPEEYGHMFAEFASAFRPLTSKESPFFALPR